MFEFTAAACRSVTPHLLQSWTENCSAAGPFFIVGRMMVTPRRDTSAVSGSCIHKTFFKRLVFSAHFSLEVLAPRRDRPLIMFQGSSVSCVNLSVLLSIWLYPCCLLQLDPCWSRLAFFPHFSAQLHPLPAQELMWQTQLCRGTGGRWGLKRMSGLSPSQNCHLSVVSLKNLFWVIFRDVFHSNSLPYPQCSIRVAAAGGCLIADLFGDRRLMGTVAAPRCVYTVGLTSSVPVIY